MSDAFVGLNQSPKPNPNAKRVRVESRMDFDVDLPYLLGRITSQAGFESVFGKTKKFDFRQGAKLEFLAESESYRGTISQINLPKRLILNTEKHGEIELVFASKNGKANVNLSVRANLEPQDQESWEQEAEILKLRLGGM